MLSQFFVSFQHDILVLCDWPPCDGWHTLTKFTTVDSLLMDTSVKQTVRVGPCLSLLPLFDSLEDGHLSETDT